MKVFMLKDVEKVGIAGQIVKVADGHALNYLIPNKLAAEVHKGSEQCFKVKIAKQKVDTQILNSKAAMLAERIKSIHVTVKARSHDDGKLYGSVGADEIVALLKEKDVTVNKKQIVFNKSIRTVGDHKVTIRLSSKLTPQVTVKVATK